MAPTVEITEYSDTHAPGHVYFGRFYLGGNGAVHGGGIPLAFRAYRRAREHRRPVTVANRLPARELQEHHADRGALR
jgi:hypothetical protein